MEDEAPDTGPELPPVVLAPIWYEPAVIETTWRFEAAGQVWFVQQQDADEPTARAIFDDYTAGAYPDAASSAYTPTNIELHTDWGAGGFVMISRT